MLQDFLIMYVATVMSEVQSGEATGGRIADKNVNETVCDLWYFIENIITLLIVSHSQRLQVYQNLYTVLYY